MMTDYDEDKAKLQRIKEALRRKYFDPSLPPEPDSDLPDGRLAGPRTREEYEQMLKDLDEATEDEDPEEDEEDDDERQATQK